MLLRCPNSGDFWWVRGVNPFFHTLSMVGWLTALVVGAVWCPRNWNTVMRTAPDTDWNAGSSEYIQFYFAAQLPRARSGEREALGVPYAGDVCCVPPLSHSSPGKRTFYSSVWQQEETCFFPFCVLGSRVEGKRGEVHHCLRRVWNSRWGRWEKAAGTSTGKAFVLDALELGRSLPLPRCCSHSPNRRDTNTWCWSIV